jgi:hypothetical protein
MFASTPGSDDGSCATERAMSAMPFQVSGSAIDTVPATVLIRPVTRPTWKSVYKVTASARSFPTASPKVATRMGRIHAWNSVAKSPIAVMSSSRSPTTPLT